jgi:hypothetical protein
MRIPTRCCGCREEIARLDILIQSIRDELKGSTVILARKRALPRILLSHMLGFPLTYISAARLIFTAYWIDSILKFAFFEGGIGQFLVNAHAECSYAQRSGINSFSSLRRQAKSKSASEYFDQFYIAAVSWKPI